MPATMTQSRTTKTTGQGASLDALEPRLEAASRGQLERMEHSLAARAISVAIDELAEPVAIQHQGRVLWARPIDTRRFVMAMAPHICFN